MQQIQILVISSVRPEPTSAGNIILYRHLYGQPEQNTEVKVIDPINFRLGMLNEQFVRRIAKTRFHRLLEDYSVWNMGRQLDRYLYSESLEKLPSIVLTVAHGDACWAAQRYARICGLPLVTFFHDWWPDIPQLHSYMRQILESRFLQLYRESDLALCVCEGMREKLGSHPNAHILYPIPERNILNTAIKIERPYIRSNKFKVSYFGNLFEYGPMLLEAMETLKDNTHICIEVRGANPNWPADFWEESRARGQWLDFAPRTELGEWLTSTDAFLVPMVFDPSMRRRMETCFPSKIAEYVQYEKPIVIWGPEYCSAVRWARKHDYALCVTDDNPYELKVELEKLRSSIEVQRHYARKSKYLCQTEFNFNVLQSQFLTNLTNLTNLSVV